MKNVLVTAIACAVALAACAAREPTDAELTTLLRRQGAVATDAKAPLDPPAINCLRAWSGDADLGKGLAAAMSTEEMKTKCRSGLDAWLASSDRNPGKLSFAQVDQPAVVRRAMALQLANADASDHRPPPGLVNSMSPKLPVAPLTPGVGLEMGAEGETLKQAETRCLQVNDLVASGKADPRVQRFATYCTTTLRQMRASMERFSTKNNPQMVDSIAKDAANLTNTADKLIAAAAAAPPAPAK